ncbi:MAG: hypothetical protein AAGH83_04930 [Pseudomonadota bacterium]
MYRFVALLSLAALLGACDQGPPEPGAVYSARNGFLVVALDRPGTFEVQSRGSAGGSRFFCAAGNYANVMLNARASDRVVVTRPVGPSVTNPGGRGVSFALVPSDAAPNQGFFSGITANVSRAGQNFTVAHAEALCRPTGRGIVTGSFNA